MPNLEENEETAALDWCREKRATIHFRDADNGNGAVVVVTALGTCRERVTLAEAVAEIKAHVAGGL